MLGTSHSSKGGRSKKRCADRDRQIQQGHPAIPNHEEPHGSRRVPKLAQYEDVCQTSP